MTLKKGRILAFPQCLIPSQIQAFSQQPLKLMHLEPASGNKRIPSQLWVHTWLASRNGLYRHSEAPKAVTLSLERARNKMSLAATITLVAALWMISSCTLNTDCSGDLAIALDRSNEGAE